ncbi:PAP2-domain-containing protein [Setomelanomma holmii]|uniref:PAP2-domain-containing protein n=1 Tax=Setomelanomma holmii TaxID=210430 RepID=A0A9P4H0N9_9PLEO|nr:PAP2-domain-containing protein [Setomelanomma holmii]
MSTASGPPQPLEPPPLPQSTPHRDIEAANHLKHRRRHPLVPGFDEPPPFLTFLRRNWYDILTQLLCVLIAFLLYRFSPPLTPRYFPVYPGVGKSAWGLKHGKPYLAEYITTITSAVVSFAVPAAVMGAIALWGTRDFRDGNAALIGLGYALSTSALFNSFIKIFIGGLRPHFLSICQPTNPPAIPGGGPSKNWYHAAQVCTGDNDKVKEAQMSFPSGHSSAAFGGFVFLTLYLNGKFKILSSGRHFRDYYGSNVSQERQTAATHQRAHHWKFVVFVTPWCIAILIAGSKIRDEWHHPVDVVFGALVGILFAHVAYRMVYRSVYDWRTNHVPMAETRAERGKDE